MRKEGTYKESVGSRGDLPLAGNGHGDIRITKDTAWQYYWSNTSASGSLSDWKLINEPQPEVLDTTQFDNLQFEFTTYLKSIERYTEYTYDGSSGDLTTIEIWDTNTKDIKLFTKAFSYTGDDLTGITITDHVNSRVMVKTLAYDGNGDLESQYVIEI